MGQLLYFSRKALFFFFFFSSSPSNPSVRDLFHSPVIRASTQILRASTQIHVTLQWMLIFIHVGILGINNGSYHGFEVKLSGNNIKRHTNNYISAVYNSIAAFIYTELSWLSLNFRKVFTISIFHTMLLFKRFFIKGHHMLLHYWWDPVHLFWTSTVLQLSREDSIFLLEILKVFTSLHSLYSELWHLLTEDIKRDPTLRSKDSSFFHFSAFFSVLWPEISGQLKFSKAV